MKMIFQRVVALFILILGVSLVGKGWHWAKDGFSIQRTKVALEEGVDVAPGEEVLAALDQSYRYLGRGHQCYAFESADQEYVLKLPRYDRYTLPFWLRSCQFPFLVNYREGLRKDREHRLRFISNSFQIAFEELKEETALLFLHLKKTRNLQTQIEIRDRMGRRYAIDLDQSAFILQRKKPLMMATFKECMAQGDRAHAEEILNAFLEVVTIRAKKGIFNKDPSFLRNFGYDGRGVQIDIGSFYRNIGSDAGCDFGPSFLQTVGHVQTWLSGEDPEVAAWFKKRTEEIAGQ